MTKNIYPRCEQFETKRYVRRDGWKWKAKGIVPAEGNDRRTRFVFGIMYAFSCFLAWYCCMLVICTCHSIPLLHVYRRRCWNNNFIDSKSRNRFWMTIPITNNLNSRRRSSRGWKGRRKNGKASYSCASATLHIWANDWPTAQALDLFVSLWSHTCIYGASRQGRVLKHGCMQATADTNVTP